MTLRMPRSVPFCLSVFLCLVSLLIQKGNCLEYTVLSDGDLARTIKQAKPGDVISIAPGKYRGGLSFQGIKGTEQNPIVIRGQDERSPPQIIGGVEGFKFSGCSYVVLEDVAFLSQLENGINIDDVVSITSNGGFRSEGMVLRRVSVMLEPKDDNFDGIKLSGISNFVIEECQIQGWSSQGCGIDMVGCSGGSIRGCFLDGQSKGQVGIQAKGGSKSIEISDCLIQDAVDRGIQIGGMTAPKSFRDNRATYEASDIQVSSSTIKGGETSIAMTGSHRATIQLCRILYPKRWFFKAIRENKGTQFLNTSGGLITKNLCVAFGRDFIGAIRVDSGVDVQTIEFQNNIWCCEDNPRRDLRMGLTVHDSMGVIAPRPAWVFLRDDLVWNDDRYEMVLEHLREVQALGKGDRINSVLRWFSSIFFTIALFASVWLSACASSRVTCVSPRKLMVFVCILLSCFLVTLMFLSEYDATKGNRIDFSQSLRRFLRPSKEITSKEQWISILDATFFFLTANVLACLACLSTHEKRKRIFITSSTVVATILFFFLMKLVVLPWFGVDGFASIYYFLIAIPFGAYTVFSWTNEGDRRIAKIQSMIHRRHPVHWVYLLSIGLLVVGVLFHLIFGGVRFDPYVIGSWLRHQYWNWIPKPFRYGWNPNVLLIDNLIILPASVLIWKWNSAEKGFYRRTGLTIGFVLIVAVLVEVMKLIELATSLDLGHFGLHILAGCSIVFVMEIIHRGKSRPSVATLRNPSVGEFFAYLLTVVTWASAIIYGS